MLQIILYIFALLVFAFLMFSIFFFKKMEEKEVEMHDFKKKQKQMLLKISHGLQTPLTIMKGEIDIASAYRTDDASNLAIEKSVDRMSGYVSNLLKVADIEFGINTDERKKTNLSEFMHEMKDYFNALLGHNKLEMQHVVQDDIHIYADKYELREIVNHIISRLAAQANEGDVIDIRVFRAKHNAVVQATHHNKIGILKNNKMNLALCEQLVKNMEGNLKYHDKDELRKKVILTIPLHK